jgi:chemotaxis receptor (MCP) glutamine deamidase CheD
VKKSRTGADLMDDKYQKYILPETERYCMPNLNEVRFIGNNQTISLVLGSCISTVFIGRGDKTVIAANHIVIANNDSSYSNNIKSANTQIGEILEVFREVYHIPMSNIFCFHVLGAGKKVNDDTFMIPEENILETYKILSEKKVQVLCNDTGSHIYATFSLSNSIISVFIENKFQKKHISYSIDINKMYKAGKELFKFFPVSAIEPNNQGFEILINKSIITFITGNRSRD